MPGTMVISQPVVPEPIPIRFPWPPYATNPEEAVVDQQARNERNDTITTNVASFAGERPEL
jgi:hypothetical protein